MFVSHDNVGNRREVFQKIVDQYLKIMEKVRQKEVFLDDDMIILQKQIDEWYADWVSVTGKEGMTNYIHVLSIVHVMYYRDKYRNLYRFRNQSWEPLKKREKRMHLQITQRRGGAWKIYHTRSYCVCKVST